MRSESLFETHQETNSQIQNGMIALMKSYKFYVFLDRQRHQPAHNLCVLQKLGLKLKERSNNSSDKYADYNKIIQLSFHDLQDQNQVQHALLQLKNSSSENKTRIVVYSKQSIMVSLCDHAKKLNLKIDNIPLVLYSTGLNNDLSAFLGWGNSPLGSLINKSVYDLQPEVRKWIMSPIEKIDTWTVQVTVHEDIGQIYRYDLFKKQQFMEDSKSINIGFISHVSIGYHPKLNYDERIQSQQTSFFDKFRYKFQGFKNFCCVGSPNMKAATGVVNLRFIDERGEEREIFKEFKDYQGNKEVNNAKRRVLSILVANIDRYSGQKIHSNENFKMNDSKLELHTFESLSSSVKIATICGQIKMTLESQKSVFIQINDECIRLTNPKDIIIRKAQTRKVLINKDTLEC